jgi:hypothetical protein
VRPSPGHAPHSPVHLHHGLPRRGHLLGRLDQGRSLGDHHLHRRHDGHTPGAMAFLTTGGPSNPLVTMSGGSVPRHDVPLHGKRRQAGQELGPREKPGVGWAPRQRRYAGDVHRGVSHRQAPSWRQAVSNEGMNHSSMAGGRECREAGTTCQQECCLLGKPWPRAASWGYYRMLGNPMGVATRAAIAAKAARSRMRGLALGRSADMSSIRALQDGIGRVELARVGKARRARPCWILQRADRLHEARGNLHHAAPAGGVLHTALRSGDVRPP